MDFAYPKLLYLLFFIPVMIGLFVLARFARRRKLARYGKPGVLADMMPAASPYKPYVKLTLECLAIAALVVAVARPRGGAKETTEERRGIEVIIAFDVSKSMLATSTDDPNGISRLNRAKYLLGKLIDNLENDKVGLVIFAGNSYVQLPITSDFVSAKMYIDEISPEMVQTQGTDIGSAIRMALNGFSPAKDVNKAIVLITDCEDHDNAAEEMARKAHDSGVQVDVIGVGTPTAALVPIDGKKGEYLKDRNGNNVMTAFDPELAQAIAKAGGGIYVNGSASDAVKQIDDYLDNIDKSDLGIVRYKASAEKFPIFVWIALVLISIDVFILDRKIGWLQNINFFSKTKK